jgi:glutaredoxin-like protein
MSMISPEDQQMLQKLFEELEGDVTVTNFTQRESLLIIPGQECDYCKETRDLLEEVTALSEKLHLETKDVVRDKQEADSLGVTRIPAFVLQGRAKGKVRYFGIPAGYEFSTLIEDLIDVSKGTTNLSDTTREALATVDQDLHIQVFVTPTCPYCPRAARLAHKLAIENEHITADVVEVSEFIDMAQRYRVQGVPKTVVNERIEMVGAVPESRFMQQVFEALDKGEQETEQALPGDA